MWNRSYWNPSMLQGRLARLKHSYFVESLAPLLEQQPNAKILVLFTEPYDLCSGLSWKTVDCLAMPVHSMTNQTGPPNIMPFPPHSFDAVIYQGIFDRSLDISRVVFELQRILKPQGVVVLDGTNRNLGTWLRHLISSKLLNLEPSGYSNWRLFVGSREMEHTLQAYGFKAVQTQHFATSLSISRLLSGSGVLDAIEVSKSEFLANYYCLKAVNKKRF
jgi:SAM-dependent methyltransferase